MTNTKRRKITLAQFFRWREYSTFLLELPKPFGLSDGELKEVLYKLNTAFRANQKYCIGDICVRAEIEKRISKYKDEIHEYEADKYTITNGADLVWVVVFLGFYFGQRRFGADELFEAWRHLLRIDILLPTQKDDEILLKKFMQHIDYPNFIGMRLCKYAYSLGISHKITSPLNAMESLFYDMFGDEWEYSGCGDDDDDDSFRRFAEFMYANVSFEVVENA